VRIQIGDGGTFNDIYVALQLKWDPKNHGFFTIQDMPFESIHEYGLNGSHTVNFRSSDIQMRYLPTALQPSEVFTNQDFFIVAFE
ncbi:hypothetical protein PENTCL1PPCAC_15326, partial [Pristionchus entomophagus]